MNLWEKCVDFRLFSKCLVEPYLRALRLIIARSRSNFEILTLILFMKKRLFLTSEMLKMVMLNVFCLGIQKYITDLIKESSAIGNEFYKQVFKYFVKCSSYFAALVP